MSSNEGVVEFVEKKRKKGVKLVEWKCEVIKKARLQGAEYVNYQGRTVSKRNIGPPCICKKKCCDKISLKDQEEIFSKFYSFESKNQQDAYLQAQIEILSIKHKRPRQNVKLQKEHSNAYKYSISCSSGKYNVCKTAFISLHAISSDRVRRLCRLLSLGKAPIDMRGKCTPGNAKPGELVQNVEDHIRSFPVKEAHYTGRSYFYLSEKLDVKKMHELFLIKYPDCDVKYKFYLKIFHEKFSLTFGRPQVDTCCKCEELTQKSKSQILNDTAKRVAVAEHIVHVRRAKKFHRKMKQVVEIGQSDITAGAICIDYMQNLMLPAIPVQDTFYLRQLTVNVFNVHDLISGKSMFYVYHEGSAKKGPNEVCSFILDFIQNYLPAAVKHLHIFSDGCAGQNKNHTLIRLCSALVELNCFESVNQYFPIRGHSFMACDRNFGVVKRRIRKTDRIYTVKEYVELILNSSRKRNFTVNLIEVLAKIKNFRSTYQTSCSFLMLKSEKDM